MTKKDNAFSMHGKIFSMSFGQSFLSQSLSPCSLSPSSSRTPEKFSLTMTPKILFSSTKCPQLFLNSAQRVLFFCPEFADHHRDSGTVPSLPSLPPHCSSVASTTPHRQPPSRPPSLQRAASPSQENQGSVLANSLSDLTEGSLWSPSLLQKKF